MKYFQSKYLILPGTSLDEVTRVARREFHKIQNRNPKRQVYVRSRYFKRDKVFIRLFWDHLAQKNPTERTARLRFYLGAIDLLRNTVVEPEIKIRDSDLLYRFAGVLRSGEKFNVQVKMDRKSGRKDFMSVFGSKEKGY